MLHQANSKWDACKYIFTVLYKVWQDNYVYQGKKSTEKQHNSIFQNSKLFPYNGARKRAEEFPLNWWLSRVQNNQGSNSDGKIGQFFPMSARLVKPLSGLEDMQIYRFLVYNMV